MRRFELTELIRTYLWSIIENAGFGFSHVFAFRFGIKHQFTEVVSKSGFVGFKSFLASVLSSVVNSDADGLCELDSQTNCFDFCKSESLPDSRSVVISDGLAPDRRSQPIKRSG